MADELPQEYDAIVLGTGFPESVVAAALARIGFKVLHLDRNDHYSGQWSTFTFDALLKWIKINQSPSSIQNDCKENQVNLEPEEQPVPVTEPAKMIHNITVASYFRNISESQSTVADADEGVANKNTDRSEGSTTNLASKMSQKCPEQTSTEVSKVSEDISKLSVETAGATEDTTKVTTTSAEGGSIETKEACTSTGNETSTEASSTVESNTSEADGLSGEPTSQVSVTDEVEPSSVPQPPTDEAQKDTSDEVTEPVFMRRSRPKPKPPVNIDMTYGDLEHHWRRFNIDIAPKVLFSRGSLVEALISANISHYAEFKVVSRILTWMNGQVEGVPCSRADVFSSKMISVVEKRVLMKFLTFCLDYEQHPEQYEAFVEKPYVEFLESRRLSQNLQHFVLHAIAMVKPDTPTCDGLRATQGFLQSLNRYGNTPFIWPLYGTGELPQAFCRMCAVFGGLYCLRRGVSAVVVNKDTKQCTGVISEGQYLKSKWVISEFSSLPEGWRKTPSQSVSRAVFLTNKSVKSADEEFISLMSVPPLFEGGEPIRVIELGPSAMACPSGLFVVHFVSKSTSSAEEDLKEAARELFHFPSEGDFESDKPTVLWSLFFNQSTPDSACVSDLPSNVHVTTLPASSLGFEEALKQAKQIFESICPGEEFLPAIPNPEDIIRDDFLQTSEQSANDGGEGSENQVGEAGAADEEGLESTDSQAPHEQTPAADEEGAESTDSQAPHEQTPTADEAVDAQPPGTDAHLADVEHSSDTNVDQTE